MSEIEADLRETLRVLGSTGAAGLGLEIVRGLGLRAARQALALLAERDRLRAALAEIGGLTQSQTAARIAREALEGKA